MIKLKDFSVGFETKLFDNVNLEIPAGKIVALVGKNGSGKSTLANVLAGIKRDFGGEVWLDELALDKRTKVHDLRLKIGLVLQNPEHQILFNSVRDELDFVLKNLNPSLSELERERKIKSALKQVEMADFIDKDPQNLSGGQKQRIAIATMLVSEPAYLIFDEATSQLDDLGKRAIYRVMKKLAEAGVGIIMITNNLNELIFADEVLIIARRKIQSLETGELIKTPEKLEDFGLSVPLVLKMAKKLQVKTLAELEEKLA